MVSYGFFLQLEDPLAANDVMVLWRRNQAPCVVELKGSELLVHGSFPCGYTESLLMRWQWAILT
jgi:hypothetical protein